MLHQIPIGPVHADIAEPAHLRLTARGRTVIRCEARLGYAHKGVLMLMRGKPPRIAARFTARLAADSTVAHSVAFARAVEAALETEVPTRAHALRTAMGEIERIAGHLAALGGLCEAAGLARVAARFGAHREVLLRATSVAFGHRLMMDVAVPGGVAVDIAPGGPEALGRALHGIEREFADLARPFDQAAALGVRLAGLGPVNPALAASLGQGGRVARVSGGAGDAGARARTRLDEIGENLRLLAALLHALPGGAVSVQLPLGSGEGIGVSEGHRGDAWCWVRLDNGAIANVFPRDPSWAQWPLLEAASVSACIEDMPLLIRSFGATASGVDL